MTLVHLVESKGPVTPTKVELYEIPVLTELLGIVPVSYHCGWCNHIQEAIVLAKEHLEVKCGYCQTENKFP